MLMNVMSWLSAVKLSAYFFVSLRQVSWISNCGRSGTISNSSFRSTRTVHNYSIFYWSSASVTLSRQTSWRLMLTCSKLLGGSMILVASFTTHARNSAELGPSRMMFIPLELTVLRIFASNSLLSVSFLLTLSRVLLYAASSCLTVALHSGDSLYYFSLISGASL